MLRSTGHLYGNLLCIYELASSCSADNHDAGLSNMITSEIPLHSPHLQAGYHITVLRTRTRTAQDPLVACKLVAECLGSAVSIPAIVYVLCEKAAGNGALSTAP
jgi:hypothetical protein